MCLTSCLDSRWFPSRIISNTHESPQADPRSSWAATWLASPVARNGVTTRQTSGLSKTQPSYTDQRRGLNFHVTIWPEGYTAAILVHAINDVQRVPTARQQRHAIRSNRITSSKHSRTCHPLHPCNARNEHACVSPFPPVCPSFREEPPRHLDRSVWPKPFARSVSRRAGWWLRGTAHSPGLLRRHLRVHYQDQSAKPMET